MVVIPSSEKAGGLISVMPNPSTVIINSDNWTSALNSSVPFGMALIAVLTIVRNA